MGGNSGSVFCSIALPADFAVIDLRRPPFIDYYHLIFMAQNKPNNVIFSSPSFSVPVLALYCIRDSKNSWKHSLRPNRRITKRNIQPSRPNRLFPVPSQSSLLRCHPSPTTPIKPLSLANASRLIFDHDTNRPKGFAFCEYPGTCVD